MLNLTKKEQKVLALILFLLLTGLAVKSYRIVQPHDGGEPVEVAEQLGDVW